MKSPGDIAKQATVLFPLLASQDGRCTGVSLICGQFEKDESSGSIDTFMKEELDESVSFLCEGCGRRIADVKRAEHGDWHFARELGKSMREEDGMVGSVKTEKKSGGVKRKAPVKKKEGSSKKTGVKKKEAANTSIQSFFKPK
jgi:hypothetical protein